MRRLAALALAGLTLLAGGVRAAERAADHLAAPGQWSLVPGTALSQGRDFMLSESAAWDEAARCLYVLADDGLHRLCLEAMSWQHVAPLPEGCRAPRRGDAMALAGGRLHAYLYACGSGAWSLDPARPTPSWAPATGTPGGVRAPLTARNPNTGDVVVFSAADDTVAEADPAAMIPARPYALRQAGLEPGDICTETGETVTCLSEGRRLFALRYGPGKRADGLQDLGGLRIADPGPSPCLTWHSGRRIFTVLPAGREVYEVEPGSLAVTRWPNPEGPAPGLGKGGVGSRCAYDAALDAILVVRSPFHDVALYRLPPPGTVQEEPNSPSAPAARTQAAAPDPVRGLAVPPAPKAETAPPDDRPAIVRGLAVPPAPKVETTPPEDRPPIARGLSVPPPSGG